MNYFKDVYYCLRYDLTRNRWLKRGKNSPFVGHVLMFHHVTDEHVDINPSCQCTVADFKDELLTYAEDGYEFVSVAKALEYIKEKVERKFVVVTFDDIPDNVYINAYPFLKEHKIPFTVFICLKMIDRGPKDITTEHLLEMSKDGLCTVGAHTMTHPLLRQVDNSAWEIMQSKIELEKVIEKPVTIFAYPFGRYSAISEKVIREVKEAGFECAFCTVDAPLTAASSEDSFFLPRIVPVANQIKSFRTEWTSLGVFFLLLKKPLKWLLGKK